MVQDPHGPRRTHPASLDARPTDVTGRVSLMRGTFPLFLLACLVSFPTVFADDIVVSQPASHFISVNGSAAAAGAAALKGDELYYAYAVSGYPQLPGGCRHAVVTYILLDPATGARHNPIVKESGGSVGVRMDGPTNGFLAGVNGGAALKNVELWVEVKCVDGVNPGTAARLVATIGVTP